MKELPILFSTSMVQAILAGRKTMTRRIIKSKPGVCMFCGCTDENCIHCIEKTGNPCWWINEEETICSACSTFPTDKAKYQIGDHLWVRETFFDARKWKHTPLFADGPDFIYKADEDAFIGCHNWQPSIFMLKEAARIWLECTNVRCERLIDISEEDAIAEGVEPYRIGYFDYNDDTMFFDLPSNSFFSLWQSINGKDAVAANPWVFVYEFQRIN